MELLTLKEDWRGWRFAIHNPHIYYWDVVWHQWMKIWTRPMVFLPDSYQLLSFQGSVFLLLWCLCWALVNGCAVATKTSANGLLQFVLSTDEQLIRTSPWVVIYFSILSNMHWYGYLNGNTKLQGTIKVKKYKNEFDLPKRTFLVCSVPWIEWYFLINRIC